jgi:aryl-alcohol dehydrogenase-like predicted oxidoreductase
VYVATKIPPKNQIWPARDDTGASEAFPGDHIRKYTEKSLQNLGVDTLDVQQFHVWSPSWLDQGDWLETVGKLKDEGKIRYFGLSLNDHQPETGVTAVASGVVDTVQVIYNIFDQSAEAELFPLCLEKDVGVLARVPFDEGGLTGAITADTTFPKGDWRNRYFAGERKAEVHARAQALAAIMGEEAGTLAELALRFCLSHPAVSTVIPGMRRVASVEANAAVSDGRRLSPALREQLRAHAWPRNFYGP